MKPEELLSEQAIKPSKLLNSFDICSQEILFTLWMKNLLK
jgi:hypothetical protein